MRKMIERREDVRVSLEGISVDAGDGTGFFRGVISDISRHGIRMAGLSRLLDTDVENMAVIISGNGRFFRMCVRPRWCVKGATNTVGVQIIKAPVGWEEFVTIFERGHIVDGGI